MPKPPKNPNWQLDLEFALDRGLTFNTACSYAEISPLRARQLGFKSKRVPVSKKIKEVLQKFNNGARIRHLAKEYKCTEGYIYKLIAYTKPDT